MASINPLQPTGNSATDLEDGASSGIGRRLRTHSNRASRRGKRRQKEVHAQGEVDDLGLPDWKGMRPVVLFLIWPALFAFAIVATGGEWDPIILYGIAGLFGLYVAFSIFTGVELVFACLLFYIPFSKVYAIPIAPMVNGTNLLILLGIAAAIIQASDKRQYWLGWPPGTTLVLVFAVFTSFSAVTLLQLPDGYRYLLYTEFLNYKSWIDQFILFAVALSAIRDVPTAKRAWTYMMVGSIFVVLYSVPEMLDKGGRSTIDKSRIDGPHLQSNNFGGFVAYTTLPLVAFFVVFMRDIRAWVMTPYFLIAAKILITTFSRGAYVAFAAGCLLIGYLKSGRFLLFWALFGISIIAIFPQILPDSVLARMGAVTADQASTSAPEKLDKSSEVRLIMWRAAGRMILESPILGKGFKAFPKLKEDYTEQFVVESDPHSMYLYLGSQMGLPSVVMFFYVMGFMLYMGIRLARGRVDRFTRAIGVGGAAAVACYAIVNVFGSRAVNSNFTMYFWTYFICLAVLYRDLILNPAAARGEADFKRKNAFVAKAQKIKEQIAADSGLLHASAENDAAGPLRKNAARRARKSRNPKPGQASRGAQARADLDEATQSAAAAPSGDEGSLGARARHKAGRATRRDKRRITKDRLNSRRNR